MKTKVFIVSCLASIILVGCGHEHTWNEATCDLPKTCNECGATEGEALGHKWIDADCLNPKTCSVCNITEGTALEHKWMEASFEAPQTCSECGATVGKKYEYSVIKEAMPILPSIDEMQEYINNSVKESGENCVITIIKTKGDYIFSNGKVGQILLYDCKKEWDDGVGMTYTGLGGYIVSDGDGNIERFIRSIDCEQIRDYTWDSYMRARFISQSFLYGNAPLIASSYCDIQLLDLDGNVVFTLDDTLKEEYINYAQSWVKYTDSCGNNYLAIYDPNDIDNILLLDSELKKISDEDILRDFRFMLDYYSTTGKLCSYCMEDVILMDYSDTDVENPFVFTNSKGEEIASYKIAKKFIKGEYALVSDDGVNFDLINKDFEVIIPNIISTDSVKWINEEQYSYHDQDNDEDILLSVEITGGPESGEN